MTCTVLAACPAARAAALAASSLADLAAAWAANAAVRTAPTVIVPLTHARPAAIARRGRLSCGCLVSNNGKTRAARLRAKATIVFCWRNVITLRLVGMGRVYPPHQLEAIGIFTDAKAYFPIAPKDKATVKPVGVGVYQRLDEKGLRCSQL